MRKHVRGKAPDGHCEELKDAAVDAEKELSRLQEIMTETVMPGGDNEEGLSEMISELDTDPAARKLRAALDMDPVTGSRGSPSNPRRFRGNAKRPAREAPDERRRRVQ